MAKIFLNYGHGGQDCGAVGFSGINFERDINKKIGKKIAWRLRAAGHSVKTFQQKNSFKEVAEKANAGQYDLIVSIHCNAAGDTRANGTETLYFPTSHKGIKAASIIQKELVAGVGLRDRGIKPRGDLHVLRHTKAPAVLVELAFISNSDEEKLLTGKPGAFSKAVAAGINEYIKGV